MNALVPNRYLFKFEFPLFRCASPPKLDGDATSWDRRFVIPPLHTLDGQSGIGEVLAAWNDGGLYLAAMVSGKSRAVHCDMDHFRKSDHLRVMTDMRDTRDIRRATRFCQQLYFMPSGGGKGRKDAFAGSTTIARATADAPPVKPGDIPIAAKLRKDGYSLTAHIPSRCLVGFDPAENPRIGFFAIIEDTELGHQSLTVDDDLNWWCDPSTWPTAVLTK